MSTGKAKCERLRQIRKDVAEKYGLAYEPAECRHEGDCAGTCPVCDAELSDLQRQLDEKGTEEISVVGFPEGEFFDVMPAIDAYDGRTLGIIDPKEYHTAGIPPYEEETGGIPEPEEGDTAEAYCEEDTGDIWDLEEDGPLPDGSRKA